MRIAVCDDNKVMLEYISRNVDEDMTSLDVTHEISNFECGSDLITQHKKTPFDVIFLDIRLPDIDGFEAARLIKNLSEITHIVFVTTESNLVYECFDYHPYYFIPKGKPAYLAEKLRSVIGKLVDEINGNWTIYLDLPHNEKKYVDSSSIIYIASKSNYIDVVCKEGIIRIRMKLNDFSTKLPTRSFVRIHNRCILNMQYLGRIDNGRCKAVLYDETELDISRSYKTDLAEKYNIFLRNLPR